MYYSQHSLVKVDINKANNCFTCTGDESECKYCFVVNEKSKEVSLETTHRLGPGVSKESFRTVESR